MDGSRCILHEYGMILVAHISDGHDLLFKVLDHRTSYPFANSEERRSGLLIEISNVTKKIGKKTILQGISCQLDHGVYGLLGPNGAGKTTLMRCMTNLYSLTDGKILIEGQPVDKKHKVPIGYLPQTFDLFQELSVQDSMKYFCNIKEIPRKDRKDEIERCLHCVNMENERGKSGGKLSGGMRRRVGVAQALLGKPELLLFDEPTAGLDPEERMRFKNTIADLGGQETVIISTHIVEDIEACCQAVLVMNEGRLLCIKTCDELKHLGKGKVIACKKGTENTLQGRHFISKQFEKEGDVYFRVLLQEDAPEGYEQLEPAIEDGYLMLTKELVEEKCFT